MAQPEKKFKCGACSASVFVNEVKTADGMVPMKSVSLQGQRRQFSAHDKLQGQRHSESSPGFDEGV